MVSSNDSGQIKSRLFTAVAEEPDSDEIKKLKRHLQDLLVVIDDSTRALCLAKLSEVLKLRTKREREAVIDSITSEVAAQQAEVEHSLSVLRFFVKALLDDSIPDGDHQHWVDDLETLGWLDSESRPVFESLLTTLRNEYLPILQTQDRQRRAAAGVLPNFNSLGITVEARAVKKERYRWGMSLEGDDAYRPEIVGTAMIASVHIGVDEGLPEDFYFQMGESDIDVFMSSLAATKLEMSALRSYLNLDAEGMVKKDA